MGKARNESVRTICLCSLPGEKSRLRNVAQAIDMVALAGLLGRFSGGGRLSRLRPVDLYLPAIRKAVAQVQVNQALVRDASFLGIALEIVHNIFRQPHSHRLLELGRIGVLAGLQFGQVVFSFHAYPPW